MDFGFHKVSQEVLDFCKVVSGSSIITILHPSTIIQAGIADLLVQYISTFFMWSAWVTTALVGLKTLSGKKTISEAFRYFKIGITNLFKKKKNGM